MMLNLKMVKQKKAIIGDKDEDKWIAFTDGKGSFTLTYVFMESIKEFKLIKDTK